MCLRCALLILLMKLCIMFTLSQDSELHVYLYKLKTFLFGLVIIC